MYVIVENDVVVAIRGDIPRDILPTQRAIWWSDTIHVGDPCPLCPLNTARRVRRTAIDGWYNRKVAEGFDTGFGFHLRMTPEDQRILAEYKVLLDAAVAAGQRTPDSQITVYDRENDPWNLTVAAYNQLMLPYGAYCEALYTQYMTLCRALAQAETVEAINAITIPD